MELKSYINIDETTLMRFGKNFSGKPMGQFGDRTRRCCIRIPDPIMANELLDMGCDVRQTKPGPKDNPDDYIPDYFVEIALRYRNRSGEPVKYPPKVYLVNLKGQRKPLTEETVGELDEARIKSVHLVLHPWVNDKGVTKLDIKTMYVEQDLATDPFAAQFPDIDEDMYD